LSAQKIQAEGAGQGITVMIVDDSAVVRQVLSSLLSADRSIKVLAAVSDPIFAMQRMEQQWPDVIVLDIEMPRMDGITFLRKLMAERPTPVVICSTLTEKGAETTLQALDAGAISIITKPRSGLKDFLQDSANDVLTAVKAASRARMSNVKTSNYKKKTPSSRPLDNTVLAPAAQTLSRTTQKIVAVGTSTGGTQALEKILTSLPVVSPGIVIVQHMPEKFTAMFAQRLNNLCQIEVREARHGDRVLPGLALVAPGGKHMQIKLSGAHYLVAISDGPPVNRHKPSVDVLFRSLARQAGLNSAGFILTGMGNDGARGLKEMRDSGAYTVAQNEESCVVFGMPKEAIELDAAKKILPLDAIAHEILHCVTLDHL
jgi:two-component system chemotaxis response regulator CheB